METSPAAATAVAAAVRERCGEAGEDTSPPRFRPASGPIAGKSPRIPGAERGPGVQSAVQESWMDSPGRAVRILARGFGCHLAAMSPRFRRAPGRHAEPNDPDVPSGCGLRGTSARQAGRITLPNHIEHQSCSGSSGPERLRMRRSRAAICASRSYRKSDHPQREQQADEQTQVHAPH